MAQNLYELTATLNNGQEKKLGDYQGKVLLIVNTASQCGFTPQYKGLQAMYDKYKGEGLEILGFPCDQFGHQEPGNDSEIQNFCEMNFGVQFPLFKKIEVNGEGTHPVFKYLKQEAPGFLSTSIKWNFTKFLVDKQGKVIKRFAPMTPPEKIDQQIKDLLKK
ncbi:glutathione peroxidase [Leptospira fluminis]|uniref:Glutathione peroxidase n=1 Tax=Leptospira fluminis TaxID=2484979 RepID=A0A4R9GSP9_9LEPT|nr:glutathione peroxidase [Leptospira fluminis]TGK21228.1 glutathione peroxidase [Leptospira fluminis]